MVEEKTKVESECGLSGLSNRFWTRLLTFPIIRRIFQSSVQSLVETSNHSSSCSAESPINRPIVSAGFCIFQDSRNQKKNQTCRGGLREAVRMNLSLFHKAGVRIYTPHWKAPATPFHVD